MNKTCVNVEIEGICMWSGRYKNLPRNQTFNLIIDYPLRNSVHFKIKTGKQGIDFIHLLKEIGKAYKRIYNNPYKYEVYGHSMGDLCLVEIHINYKKKEISLEVDS